MMHPDPIVLIPGPVPLVVTRWKCPHCNRGHSSRAAAFAHIGRCWRNPALRGCKSCKHFSPAGYEWDEDCGAGVSLAGHGEEGNDDYVRPGPIVGCDKWEAKV